MGLTIVAFGTSAPELVVNIFATLQNYPDIIISNVIGSNIFNLLFILGITGLITKLVVHSNTVWREIPISMFAIIIFFGLANDFLLSEPEVSRIDGFILLAIFGLFLFYMYRQLQQDTIELSVEQNQYSTLKIIGFIMIGLIGLTLGGKFVVTNAVKIATTLRVSEKTIGATIIAPGTSLPELATSITAAIKKRNDIAMGNIIGSNIFNIFFIVGVSSMIKPIKYNVIFNIDFYFIGAATIFLFVAMFTGDKKKLDSWEAVILLLSYIGYIIYLL